MWLPHYLRSPALDPAATYLPSNNPTSLVAWFRMGVGVTSSGGFVSQWDDQSGNGRHLKQATGSAQPSYDGSAVITFDGTAQYMKCTAFTLAQPTQVSILFKQISWTSTDSFFDGDGSNSLRLFQWTASPRIDMYAGSFGPNNPSDMTVGTFFAVSALFSGTSSKLKVGNATENTGNAGTASAGGFTLGVFGSAATAWANMAVKEIIIRNVDDATIRANDHAYLQTL